MSLRLAAQCCCVPVNSNVKPRMQTRCFATAVLVSFGVALLGCSQDEPLVVRIYPDRYEVEGVQSQLATPVVDEVVRRKPRLVHVYQCMTGATERSFQFWTELNARHKTQMEGGFLPEKECK